MNFSKKSRYGITALIDLALCADGQCVQLSSIAERNNISVKYLEQIFSSLRKAGLIKSVKGPQGGYLLGKRPEQINMAMVVEALDGSYLLEDEVHTGNEDERGISTAIQRRLIDKINCQTEQLLKDLTLKSLVDSSLEYSNLNQEMYYI
ncbi:MAG: Rrf2 family transcriptional regulator [Lachnospiraceae bacterium]|nr:Rrf2 family transcriptional regulator [Lachnospiraceae bacterium]MDY5498232.1 Rrf2 family transcriptional regulator [Anaerobutyricum sp.]